MQRLDGRFVYSASDLNNYLECKRLTGLDTLVARGLLLRPESDYPQRELRQRKGEEHERRYLAELRAPGEANVVSIERPERRIEAYAEAEARTLAQMREGRRFIYQAVFFDGTFVGYADFLRRVEQPSSLGSWSYAVIDTKLALESKPYFLVQLCNYSEHLERLQGVMPEFGYVVFGDGREEAFRLNDYFAYYRHLKASFLAYAGEAQSAGAPLEYPYKRSHCANCSWNDACTQQRRNDDHLSLVAWMRRDQVVKFNARGIATTAQLAEATDAQRPDGMPEETFVKLRRQARLQVRGRSEKRTLHEILPPEPAGGFALLPAPAPGDVFFDIEGDPLYEPGRGLEYLFGLWLPGDAEPYRAFWAANPGEEKPRFEELVDFLIERRRRYPAMHVYHYAPNETAALKRLKQQHCTREDEVDELLRSQAFVDLYTILRQALALSTESYSLKKVEAFYELERATRVRHGDESVVMFEEWLQTGERALREDIEAYNRDDCRSTHLLRDWLLERRAEAIAAHGEIPFRAVKLPDRPCHQEFQLGCKTCESNRKKEREEQRRTEIENRLRSSDLPLAHFLAHVVAYHRREEQPEWWAYYSRMENLDELLEFDREAVAGLRLLEDEKPERMNHSLVYTYEFPDQLHKMGPGQAVDPRTRKTVTIVDVDDDRNRVRVRTKMTLEQARAIKELIPPGPIRTDAQKASLARLGEAFLAGTLERDFPAAYDLLANRDPRPQGRLQPDVVTADAVSAAAQRLQSSYLFVQGPPGSGKSTIGSQVICDLLAARKRVAVMSTGHKAIHNLLRKVELCMQQRGRSFKGLYKHGGDGSEYAGSPFISSVDDNDPFSARDYDLAGGTAWLFSRPELVQHFDYLFIDEAGQVSLVDALAVAACAKNIVLLGDPSQLAQVSKASHPLDAAAASVLEHLLGDAQTVLPNRGVFLDVSYRMHPEICSFVSDMMYGGRLKAAPETALHRIFDGTRERAGLSFVAIDHDGNSSSSPQEAEAIAGDIVRFLGVKPPPSAIVVTPYNAQRRLIAQKLRAAGADVPVGTVDKFQGQEAAVVFYSMATSSGEDVPRDIKFLFERNRFNVAISRAQALSVLVCSPKLLDAACSSAEEMALVNLLCAFAERASSSRLELQIAAG
jgi:predicted RecB family nuclease